MSFIDLKDKVSHCCRSKVLLTNGIQAVELSSSMPIDKGRTYYYICKKCHRDCYALDKNIKQNDGLINK